MRRKILVCDESRDVRCGRIQDAFGSRLAVVASAIGFGFRQIAESKRWAFGAGIGTGLGRDGAIGDARIGERIFTRKQRVETVEQQRIGSPVREQRVSFVGCLRRFVISVDVSAAKTVNRLLRIANVEQPVETGREQALEDRVLQRIGVLKLVDERGFVLRAERSGQCVRRRAEVESVVQAGQEIVEIERVAEPLALGELDGCVGQEIVIQLPAITLREIRKRFAKFEQRVLWRRPFFCDVRRHERSRERSEGGDAFRVRLGRFAPLHSSSPDKALTIASIRSSRNAFSPRLSALSFRNIRSISAWEHRHSLRIASKTPASSVASDVVGCESGCGKMTRSDALLSVRGGWPMPHIRLCEPRRLQH